MAKTAVSRKNVSLKKAPLTRLQRKAQTRRALVDAALGLSAQVGFAGLSLREVTRAAGVVPTTFYRHFNDMDGLGLALIDEVGLSLRQLMREARVRVGQGGSVVRSSIEVFMEFVHGHANLFRLLLGERSGSSPPFRRALHAEMNRFIGELTEDLERGSAKQGTPLPNADLIAEAVVAVVFTLGAEALDLPTHRRQQLTERIIQEVRIILHGAAALAKTQQKAHP